MSDTPRTDKEIEIMECADYYCDEGTKEYEREMVDVDFARELERENAELKERVTELELLFELQHKRTAKADKLWQQAHNQPDVWPDLGKLIEWLLLRLKNQETVIEANRAAIKDKDALIEQMREALKALKQRHYVNDGDNWYSCPASGLCSNDHAGTDCNCGADHANSIIQAALRAADGGE